MRRYLIISLLLTTLSCKQHHQKELLVIEPTLEPLEQYQTPTIKEAFFQERHFNYKDKYRYDFDSTKQYYTSESVILMPREKQFLRTCRATLRNDSLTLELNDNPFGGSLYELRVFKHKNHFTTEFYQTFSVTDSSYRLPVYTVLGQSILLNKERYIKGETLMGKIAFDISAYHTAFDTTFTDTIKVYGLIKTVVQ